MGVCRHTYWYQEVQDLLTKRLKKLNQVQIEESFPPRDFVNPSSGVGPW